MVVLDPFRERWVTEGILLGAQYALVRLASAAINDLIIMGNLGRLTNHESHTQLHPRNASLDSADFRVLIVINQRTIVLMVDDGQVECGDTTSVVVAEIRK